ncbi:MAG: hypothetical protein ACRCVX_02165 [Shewanella sp.]
MIYKAFDVDDGVVFITKEVSIDSMQPVLAIKYLLNNGISFGFTSWFHADVAGYRDRDIDFDSYNLRDAELFAARAKIEASAAYSMHHENQKNC